MPRKANPREVAQATLRLPPEVLKRLDELAEKQGLSRQEYCEAALTMAVDNEQRFKRTFEPIPIEEDSK